MRILQDSKGTGETKAEDGCHVLLDVQPITAQNIRTLKEILESASHIPSRLTLSAAPKPLASVARRGAGGRDVPPRAVQARRRRQRDRQRARHGQQHVPRAVRPLSSPLLLSRAKLTLLDPQLADRAEPHLLGHRQRRPALGRGAALRADQQEARGASGVLLLRRLSLADSVRFVRRTCARWATRSSPSSCRRRSTPTLTSGSSTACVLTPSPCFHRRLD